MRADRQPSFSVLCALPFVAVGLAGARPLHDLPAHGLIGLVVFACAIACIWRLAGPALMRGRVAALAGVLLLAPWLLIGLAWTGLGAPFQASAVENQQRFVLLEVGALLVGAGFLVLRDALVERGERFVGSAMFAAAVQAAGLYVVCIAITLAQATMAVQGDRTPIPPVISHLYDAIEFFACVLTYAATALAALAMGRAGLMGRTAARVVVVVCCVAVVLLILRGIEYPDITGQTAPWYTQPGVIVRIPAIPWLMPGLLGALLLRRSREVEP